MIDGSAFACKRCGGFKKDYGILIDKCPDCGKISPYWKGIGMLTVLMLFAFGMVTLAFWIGYNWKS